MPGIKLIGGYYNARSLIANAQRCVNLYPEKNQEDSPWPYTQYPTPGLTWLAQGQSGLPWRGLYFLSTGKLIGVLGNNVYYIDSSWKLNLIGTINSPQTFGTLIMSPVSIFENGIQGIIVDNTTVGYQIDVNSLAFSQISDPTATFTGATKVDYLDTYLLFNQPNTRNFYSSLSNEVAFDNLYVAAKTVQPDLLQTLLTVHREFLLIGQRTTEAWYDAGNANFPFAIVPGVFIEQGTPAPYSPQKHDIQAFWLTDARDGSGSVLMYTNYSVKKISTPAIANVIRKYALNYDAIGMTYKQADHVFYVLTFPTNSLAGTPVGATWVFDANEGLWHERMSVDPATGQSGRWRVNCIVEAYGTLVGGDYLNGKLYSIDLENPTEDGVPIIRRRGIPHLTSEGKYVEYTRVRLDIETGTATDVVWQGADLPPAQSYNSEVTGWQGNTVRIALPATVFPYNLTGSKIGLRLIFGPSTVAGGQVVAYVGSQGGAHAWSTLTDQVQLTFAGSMVLSLNGGYQIVETDLVDFTSTGQALVVSLALIGATAITSETIVGATGAGSAVIDYTLAGNDAAGAGSGGYATGTTGTIDFLPTVLINVPAGASGAIPNLWPEFAPSATDSVGLRISQDRGRSFQLDPRQQPLGTQGQTLTYPEWHQLGTMKDCVLEFFWSATGQAALNGPYVEMKLGKD